MKVLTKTAPGSISKYEKEPGDDPEERMFSNILRKGACIALWEELGISSGTAIIVLIALYFIIKWAVRNGIKEAYREMKSDNFNED